LSIFTILLAKLSGELEIIVGTPTAGRRHAELENIIGMFVNTLAMRNTPGEGETFREYLREVKENTLQAFDNQEYPFEDLVDRLSVRRETGRNPIFDVMFNMLEIPRTKQAGNKTQANEPPKESPAKNELFNKKAKFDLTLTTKERGRSEVDETGHPGEIDAGSLEFQFEYRVKLFKEETIRRFITYFKGIMQKIFDEPHQKIGEIEIITEEEKNRNLYEFNETAVDYPREKTIHQLFG
ncbi:MAG: hypothetical protein GY757_62460, partial [bacterium]|nr:hypothetical protein [bacterium]